MPSMCMACMWYYLLRRTYGIANSYITLVIALPADFILEMLHNIIHNRILSIGF